MRKIAWQHKTGMASLNMLDYTIIQIIFLLLIFVVKQ